MEDGGSPQAILPAGSELSAEEGAVLAVYRAGGDFPGAVPLYYPFIPLESPPSRCSGSSFSSQKKTDAEHQPPVLVCSDAM